MKVTAKPPKTDEKDGTAAMIEVDILIHQRERID